MDYPLYLVLLIGAIIFSSIASLAVQSTFNKYNKRSSSGNATSNQVVEAIFRDNGIDDVSITHISGTLTDNYNPKSKTLNLSDSTYNNSSIAAIGVAAHEAGHSIQHHVHYPFLVLRSAMVPVVNIGSKLGVVLAIIGLFIAEYSGAYSRLTDLGIVLYSFAFLFTLVTLPVEFNASHRAIKAIKASGRFSDEDVSGMRKVLTAAAMTYVAAMVSSLVSLLRFISIFARNRNNRD